MFDYNQLKPGIIFILEGAPCEVLESEFLRMQQRKPVVRAKIKNLASGKILERTFHQNDSFEKAEIEKRKVKYLYEHRGKFFFCEENNPAARFDLSREQIREIHQYLKQNALVDIMVFNGKILNVSLPIKIDFKVLESPPGIKGDTAQGGTKAVVIETGAKINTPLFIEAGDIIKINTQTGEYVERVRN